MGPFKCPECGVWWAGFEHRCRPTVTTSGSGVTYVITEPTVVTGGATATPYCAACRGHHIPGQCPASGTFSFATFTAGMA